jgi:hypothetical protein
MIVSFELDPCTRSEFAIRLSLWGVFRYHYKKGCIFLFVERMRCARTRGRLVNSAEPKIHRNIYKLVVLCFLFKSFRRAVTSIQPRSMGNGADACGINAWGGGNLTTYLNLVA